MPADDPTHAIRALSAQLVLFHGQLVAVQELALRLAEEIHLTPEGQPPRAWLNARIVQEQNAAAERLEDFDAGLAAAMQSLIDTAKARKRRGQ